MGTTSKKIQPSSDACELNEVVPKAYVSAPILRYGRAISASVNGRRFAFMESQMDRAIKTLHKHRRKFLKPLKAYFIEKGWEVDDSNELLSDYRMVFKEGAVLDFPEIMVSKEGCKNVVRISITVCVDKSAELEEEHRKDQVKCDLKRGICYFVKPSDLTLYSKIWMRTASVECNGKSIFENKADNHLEFVEEFEMFSSEIIDELTEPYKIVLKDMTGYKVDELEIKQQQDISNLTINGMHDSLSEMHDKIKQRKFVLKNCESLSQSDYRFLFERYFDYLNDLGPVDGKTIGCGSLHAFSARYTKAVYSVAYMKGVTRFFGIAHEPYWSPEKFVSSKDISAWKYSPANVLGAIAMTGIASSL